MNLKFIAADSFSSFSTFSEIPVEAFVVSRFTGGGFYFTGALRSIELEETGEVISLPKDRPGNEISHEDYLAMIGKALDGIESGLLEKVVLSRTKTVQLDAGFSALSLFRKLNTRYPSAFVYLLKIGEEVWAGATPETLVRRKGLHVQTLSLAGTLRKESGNFTSKEIHEQQLVTDFILVQLEPHTVNIQVKGPVELNAGPIRHLATHMEANLKSENDFSLLMDALPPTPAVSGLPRPAAMQFISENEGYNRQLYAGYLGYHTEKQSLFFVNLRCVQLFESEAVLYAGGGIVKSSDPEREWQETEEKMRVVGDLL